MNKIIFYGNFFKFNALNHALSGISRMLAFKILVRLPPIRGLLERSCLYTIVVINGGLCVLPVKSARMQTSHLSLGESDLPRL